MALNTGKLPLEGLLRNSVLIKINFTMSQRNPSHFGLGHFGQFFGWVVSALVGGSFRPIFGVSRFGSGSFRPKAKEINKV